MGRPLTQVERDLNLYTQEKTYKLLLDVIQSFEITGRPKADAIACVGSVLLRIGATLAVHCNADRARWLAMCSEVFAQAQQAKKEDDDD